MLVVTLSPCLAEQQRKEAELRAKRQGEEAERRQREEAELRAKEVAEGKAAKGEMIIANLA